VLEGFKAIREELDGMLVEKPKRRISLDDDEAAA
jgi:hypothetical protein